MQDETALMAQLVGQYQNFNETNDHYEIERPVSSFDDDFFSSNNWSMLSPFQSPIISPIRPILKSPDLNSENKEKDDPICNEITQNENKITENTTIPTNIVHITQHINNFSIIQVRNDQLDKLEQHEFEHVPIGSIIKINCYKPKNMSRPKKQSSNEKRKHRKNFPEVARAAMKSWLLNHWIYPYPSTQERQIFARQFNLTDKQIQVFLTNQRARLLKRKGIGKNIPFFITKKK